MKKLMLALAVCAGLSLFTGGARAQNPINLNGSTLDLTPVADTSVNGLSGRQFPSAGNDTQRIDFTQTAASIRVDGMIDFADNTQLPPGNAIQWIGMVNIQNAGSYSF